MRILHVVTIPDARTGGGIIERTLHLSRALTALGAECTMLTLDIGLSAARRQELAHVQLEVVPCLNQRFYVPGAWPGSVTAAVGRADIVELTGHWTALNALAYAAARRAHVPYIVQPAGALGVIGRSVSLKHLYNVIVGRSLIRRASGFVAVTKGEAEAYGRYGISPDRLTVIPNGIDSPDIHDAAPNAFAERHGLVGRRIILYVGRLSLIKGPDLLLDAFADVAGEIPDYALVFAGPDDGSLPDLRRRAAERGIGNRVRFVGYLAGREKMDAYLGCDFLALPSRREAMSMVALEAGAHGKPVLLTDQCGFDAVATCGGGAVVEVSGAGVAQWIAHDGRASGGPARDGTSPPGPRPAPLYVAGRGGRISASLCDHPGAVSRRCPPRAADMVN